jgi:hypothetical protein
MGIDCRFLYFVAYSTRHETSALPQSKLYVVELSEVFKLSNPKISKFVGNFVAIKCF